MLYKLYKELITSVLFIKKFFIILYFKPKNLNFVKNTFNMFDKEMSTTTWWAIFALSTVALLAAIFLKWEYLTMIIPFVCTGFVKAMRIM